MASPATGRGAGGPDPPPVDPFAVRGLIRDETPGIAAKRRRYLFEQAPRRNPQHVEELRELYGGICRLCGWNPKPLYRKHLCEADRMHWLYRDGDDALHNTVLICPNYHRAIHRTDAPIDWTDASFVFPRKREPAQVSRHELLAQ